MRDYNDMRIDFRARKSIFSETSGYRNVYARPYEVNVNNRSIIDDFMTVTEDATNINKVGIAKVASNIIMPSAVPEHMLNIDGGWSDKRMVFMISVEHHEKGRNYPILTVLSGYTDKMDVSLRGSIAHDTKLYINNVQTFNTTGGLRPQDTANLISGGTSVVYGYEDYARKPYMYEPLTVMRPYDIVVDINSSLNDDSIDSYNTAKNINQMRVLASRRSNSMANYYLNDIVKAVTTERNASDFHGLRESSGLGAALTKLSELNLTRNALLRELKYQDEFVNDGFVYWGDLQSIISKLDDETVIATRGGGNGIRASNSFVSDSNDWSTADNETVAATIIAQAMPAILTNAMVTYVSLEFSTETLDGRPYVRIDDVLTFDNAIDPNRQVQVIESMIEHELIPLLVNGDGDITVKMEFDILTDARMNISLDGEPFVPYTSPCFCDSLLSPVVTNNSERVANISRNISALIDAVNDNYTRGLYL